MLAEPTEAQMAAEVLIPTEALQMRKSQRKHVIGSQGFVKRH